MTVGHDQKLRRRSDHCSPGLAWIAVREGFQACSFKRTGKEVNDAVGGSISAVGERHEQNVLPTVLKTVAI